MRVEKSIRIEAPRTVVYNYWTQFERFPLLIPGVLTVHRKDQSTFLWRAEIWSHEVEWEAEICEHVAGQRIAWRSTKGHPHEGTVTFNPVGQASTEMKLTINYPLVDVLDWIGSALGAVQSTAANSLECFRDFVENRPSTEGTWRHGGEGPDQEGSDWSSLPQTEITVRQNHPA